MYWGEGILRVGGTIEEEQKTGEECRSGGERSLQRFILTVSSASFPLVIKRGRLIRGEEEERNALCVKGG